MPKQLISRDGLGFEKGVFHSGTESDNVLDGASGTRWFAWAVRAMNATVNLFKLMIKVYCRERQSNPNDC